MVHGRFPVLDSWWVTSSVAAVIAEPSGMSAKVLKTIDAVRTAPAPEVFPPCKVAWAHVVTRQVTVASLARARFALLVSVVPDAAAAVAAFFTELATAASLVPVGSPNITIRCFDSA